MRPFSFRVSAGFGGGFLGRDGDQVILRGVVRGAAMTVARPFLSTFVNRVDAKGRISVPARYREVLDAHLIALLALDLQVLDHA